MIDSGVTEFLCSSHGFTLFLALVLFILIFWRQILQKYKYPPGPIPLPFIGNSLSAFAECRARYRYSKYVCIFIMSSIRKKRNKCKA